MNKSTMSLNAGLEQNVNNNIQDEECKEKDLEKSKSFLSIWVIDPDIILDSWFDELLKELKLLEPFLESLDTFEEWYIYEDDNFYRSFVGGRTRWLWKIRKEFEDKYEPKSQRPSSGMYLYRTIRSYLSLVEIRSLLLVIENQESFKNLLRIMLNEENNKNLLKFNDKRSKIQENLWKLKNTYEEYNIWIWDFPELKILWDKTNLLLRYKVNTLLDGADWYYLGVTDKVYIKYTESNDDESDYLEKIHHEFCHSIAYNGNTVMDRDDFWLLWKKSKSTWISLWNFNLFRVNEWLTEIIAILSLYGDNDEKIKDRINNSPYKKYIKSLIYLLQFMWNTDIWDDKDWFSIPISELKILMWYNQLSHWGDSYCKYVNTRLWKYWFQVFSSLKSSDDVYNFLKWYLEFHENNWPVEKIKLEININDLNKHWITIDMLEQEYKFIQFLT